jgi:16S rRNA (cytidine1402-2'-O)-methyltransferase
MDRHSNYHNDQPTLYLIPTPIGNMEDITFRAISIMKSVDALFAEDTRVSVKLMNYYNIAKPLKSYHDHNKNVQTEVIMGMLKEGLNIGLISDAGMPLLSDPGYEIAKAAIDAGFNVVSLPGANAALTGLSMSGIKPYPFIFYGFLNAKSGKRQKELETLRTRTETLIFYEAPHRLSDTLYDLYKVLGDRQACIAREISKKFEEMIRGTLSELKDLETMLGEMVVIVEGYDPSLEPVVETKITDRVNLLISGGLTKSDAMKKVAGERGITKSVVYKEYLLNQPSK